MRALCHRMFWFVAAIAAPAIGCGARPLRADAGMLDTGTGSETGLAGAAGTGAAGGAAGTFTPAHAVDVLFLVDDSSGTRSFQDSLIASFAALMSRLQAPPSPASLHVAVVSSDLGAGDGSSGCDVSGGGKKGIFQYAPRGACASTGLDPGATYIVDTGTQRNYAGAIADVFACIARLGDAGCGFEHQLAAVARALGADGRPAPAENQGFLRDDAYLFIVLVTNEDDCSAPPGSGLFDLPDAPDAPLGFLGNYRCNEFGHLCNGVKPPRLPPSGSLTDVVTLDDCKSAERAGMLIPVADVAAGLRALKPFPEQQIVVTAIAGTPAPYTVRWQDRPNDPRPRPHIQASCARPDGFDAAPSVRIVDFLQAFGANGLLLPACADDYAPAADRIQHLLAQTQ